MSPKASWVIVIVLGDCRESDVEEDKGDGEGVLVSSLLISPQIPGFREMM